jgi:hypothetical protein
MLAPSQLDLLDPIPPLRSRMRQRFVDALLAGKATREAIEASGSRARGRSADTVAARWLGKVDVATHLALRRRLAVEAADITAAMVLRETGRIAFAEKSGFGGGLVIRMADKLGALRLLCEHLGLLKTDNLVNVNVMNRLDAALSALPAEQASELADALEAVARGEISGEVCADSRAAPAPTTKSDTSDTRIPGSKTVCA